MRLLLQPRNFKSKVVQKKRRLLAYKHKKSLTYGTTGLLLLQTIHLTAKRIVKLKTLLRQGAKKTDITKRFVWFYAFPHLPLSRKPDGVRMGKGKGKLACWFTAVAAGTVLFEFINLRFGRSLNYCKRMTYKLGVRTRHLAYANVFITHPLTPSKKVLITSYW